MPGPSAADGAVWQLTATQAARAVRDGDVSALELVEAALARAAEVDPGLGAFTARLDAAAREEAARRDAEVHHGTLRGPLHGIPLAVKDVIDVAGLPTAAGSRVPDRRAAARDAAVVARLRAAGAVLIGKTTTHELAIGVTTRATANPWDHARIAGGSSGGSAVAVAAGAVPLALGTDTAGSLRIPAAFCNVSALKPRRGALPMDGIVALAPTMDVCGPLARTAEDLQLAWQALTGALPAPPQAAMRLGVPSTPCDDLDPEIGAAVAAAVDALCASGAEPATVALPPFSDWDGPRGLTLTVEALERHRAAGWYPARAERYDAEARTYLERAAAASPERVQAARERLGDLVRHLCSAVDEVDVLVLPVTPVPPALRAVEGDVARADARLARTLTRYCGPANAAGLAAVAVPCGFTRAGLPIGVQFVAREEATALRLATAYQQLTDVQARRPPEPPQRKVMT